MVILDGKSYANEIRESIKKEVIELKHQGVTAGLAVILVGNDVASQTYVNMKSKACKEAGIYSIVHEFPDDISEDKILETIKMINVNPNIDGVLVQLPLPKHINQTKILEAIYPLKDVDGFHPYNFGRVFANLDSFIPATPYGVIKLLKKYKIKLEGANCVVVGASNIVGKPMASLLLNENATVEICHIYTKNLKEHTLRADILVVGDGKAHLITEDMVKDGAVVIDIGINKLNDKLVGDVDFDKVALKCSFITPVPGGVGPMTIAMLLENTIKSAKLRVNNER